MSYTLGQWMVDRRTVYTMIGGSEDRIVAQIKGNDGEATANARLIAAAPELLKALKQLLNGHAGLGTLSYQTACGVALGVIAKAEGRR